MPITVERLLATLQRSRALPEQEFNSVFERLCPDGAEPANFLFVQELVREQFLTSHQAKIVADGGSLEFGEYVIVNLIGSGIVGTVYEAWDPQNDRLIALRVLNDTIVEQVKTTREFEQAVEPAVYLTHRNLVDQYDVGVRHGRRYVVSELNFGITLQTTAKKSARVSVVDSLVYLLQAARGLAHAHSREIYHGSLSPQNMFVGPDHQIRISDFGIGGLRTRFAIENLLANKGTDAAVFDYIAPEQFRNPRRSDEQSDIYSLGCILFFLLAARPPFGGRGPADKRRAHSEDPIPRLSDLRDDVPPEVQTLLERMVAKSPRNRFEKMDAVIDAVNRVLATIERGTDADAFQQPFVASIALTNNDEIEQSPRQKNRRPIGLLVYFVTTIAIAAALLAYFGRNWNGDGPGKFIDQSESSTARESLIHTESDRRVSLTENYDTKSDSATIERVDATPIGKDDSPELLALIQAIQYRFATQSEPDNSFEIGEIGEIRRLGVGDIVISESEQIRSDKSEIDRLRCIVAQGERIEIKRLNLSKTTISNDDLICLSPLISLKSLSLYQCDHITDEGMSYLADLTNLESIDLRGTFITSAGLASLPNAPIQSIMINSVHNQMNGNVIDQLAHRFDKSLTTLWIDGISLDENEFRSLSRLVKLKDLRLTYVGIPTNWLRHLQGINGLVNLNLAGNEGIDDGSLDHLERIEGLKTLNLNSTSVRNREKFKTSLAACEIVWE